MRKKLRGLFIFGLMIGLLLTGCTKNLEANAEGASETVEQKESVDTEQLVVSDTDENPAQTEQTKSEVELKLLYDAEFWDIYDWSEGPYPTKEAYEDDVYRLVDEITTLLHKEDWLSQYSEENDTYYLKLESYTLDILGVMGTPVQYTENSVVNAMRIDPTCLSGELSLNPVCHELVHMITYDSKLERHALSMELNDGLCEYVSRKIGMEDSTSYKPASITEFFGSIDLTLMPEEQKQAMREVIDTLGMESDEYLYHVGTVERNIAYMLNLYFVKYIIETYGMDDFLELHNVVDDEAVMREHVNRLGELKTEWMNSEADTFAFLYSVEEE